MREQEFRDWLEAKDYSPNTIATWLSDGRKVDKIHSLDGGFGSDHCKQILEQLSYSKADSALGKSDSSGLNITGPLYNNLAACRAAVRSYVRFREAQANPEGTLSDLDRRIILEAIDSCDAAGSVEAFISSLEDRGIPHKFWLVHGGKRYPSKAIVHWSMRKLGIEANAGGSVCKSALEDLGFVVIDWPAFLRARDNFLRQMPEFTSFQVNQGAYWEVERQYKNELIDEACSIVDAEGDNRSVGQNLFRLLATGGNGRPLSWRTLSEIENSPEELSDRFYSVLGILARNETHGEEAITATARELEALREAGIAGMRRGEVLSIPITIWATIHPDEASWFKIAKIEEMGKRFFGRKLFGQTEFREEDLAEWLQLMRVLFSLLDSEFGWQPLDLFDVQGFVWVALGGNERGEEFLHLYDAKGIQYEPIMQSNQETGNIAYRIKTGSDNKTASSTETPSLEEVAKALLVDRRPVRIAKEGESHANYLTFPGKLVRWEMSPTLAAAVGLLTEGPAELVKISKIIPDERRNMNPTNLILYGPPGTGKTYSTAREAVQKCDGSADYASDNAGRKALLARYKELRDEKRIAFVTFHQNYDYESFVEGLRPETRDGSAGFSLEPQPGIFREICALAEQAMAHPTSSDGVSFDFTGKRFWKMGQGAIGTEDDVYDDALAQGHIALGYGGTIDWSEDRFDDFEAIKTEWLAANPEDRRPSNWTQMWPFRSEMKQGDLVIIPYGNTAFRAIGEIQGDYRFDPDTDGYYPHRRDVRWLLELDEPLPLDTIIDGNFSMRTLYSIPAKRINHVALGRLIGSSRHETPQGSEVSTPDQFVLIIDEINRANISKVFGELITLIEPDKRLGMDEALKVQLPYSRKSFGVPANLHIVGTMNTADRSIALLDTALRRRFRFKEMPPKPNLLVEVEGIKLPDVLSAINQRIEYLLDRDHAIGHSFFMGKGGESRADIDDTMRFKIIPLLQEYFFDDWSRIHAVLGDGFVSCRKIDAPPFLADKYAVDERLSWSILDPFTADCYDRLVSGKEVTNTETHSDDPSE